MHRYDMMDNNLVWGFGPSLISSFFGFLVLVIIILVVVRVFKNYDRFHGHKVTPLDIAKERYAKGEITKEEFAQLKKDLS